VLDLIILPLRKKVAAQQLEQTKLRVANEVLRLVADVKSAYYTAQAKEQLLARLRVIVEANEAGAELSKRQHEAGTVNELDWVNRQALYHQTKLEVLQGEAQARLDREKLNRLMGLSGATARWKIAAELPQIPQEEFSLEELETLALSQRLDYAVTSNHVALVTRALSLRKNTRFLPTEVNIGFDAERETDRQWVLGPTLELEIPIFDQGQGQVGRLQAQLRQAQRVREALATEIRFEVREANALLNANRTAAQVYGNVLLPQRTRILDLTLEHYNFMLKGTYDLLSAKQQQAQTERAYIEAWRDYWIARSELERAVGGKLAVGGPSGQTEAAPVKKPEQPQGETHEHHHH
jgi:cobalt-zinc-cadmium efflux system outer membrane protein